MATPASNQSGTDDTRSGEPRSPQSSRRSFLKGVGVVTAGGVMATLPGTALRGAFATSRQTGNVLVVVSLRGGSDGLSLVVPYGDPAYAESRPTIGIPPSVLLQHDGTFGLHPGFLPLSPMWADGRMAAVQAVGQPHPNVSSFWATQQAEEADPGSTERIGWLNRMTAMTDPTSQYGAVQVGGSVPETAISGPQRTLATADVANVRVYAPRRLAALHLAWDQVDSPLGAAVRTGMKTAADWSSVPTAPGPLNGARYPGTDLGSALAQSARLVRSGVGVDVITVDHSSWDMTENLGTYDHGRMARMVDDLARSIGAFFTDLGALGSAVTLLTTSEFGRGVIENAVGGLANGWGNAMLVMGAGVEGGSVHGSWPGCGESQTEDGSLRVTTDYRSVLCEVVTSRFPVVGPSELFPGFKPRRVGVMQGA